MLKRLNINLAFYYKTAFFNQISLALHKHFTKALWYVFANFGSTLSSLQRMVKARAEASHATFYVNPAHEIQFTSSPQSRTEILRVNISCTQKIVALLFSFCQQVTRADGHHPRYKYTTIFTLLTESGFRGTCCSPCSISASNTELWTETARLQIQGKLPFPLQSLSLFPWVPSVPPNRSAHAPDSCHSTAKMN